MAGNPKCFGSLLLFNFSLFIEIFGNATYIWVDFGNRIDKRGCSLVTAYRAMSCWNGMTTVRWKRLTVKGSRMQERVCGPEGMKRFWSCEETRRNRVLKK